MMGADADVQQAEVWLRRMRVMWDAGDRARLDPPGVEAGRHRQAAGCLGLECGRQGDRLASQYSGDGCCVGFDRHVR
jgi:hypothetical protein